MDDVKARIRGIAKWLRVICTIAKAALIIMMAATVIEMGVVFLQPEHIGDIESVLGRSEVFELLTVTADLGSMQPVYRKAIELMITLLSLATFLVYANFFRKLIAEIIQDGQPFTMARAKRMRRFSYALLLLLFVNFVLGIVLFLVMRFFALLFEYGAYLQEKADATNRIQEEIIVSFAEITENKSGQTGQHVRRVSEYARILAKQLGLSDTEVENVRLASIMHDIGKLLIPSEILEKPGRLTDEEFAEIKKHTTYGGQLLNDVEGDVMGLAREIALEHHERYDGRGYPKGLEGQRISLEGRIVAVADVYDALTSRRSYKHAWDEKDAYEEILRGSGTQFDAKVVEAFAAAHDQIDAARQKYADA